MLRYDAIEATPASDYPFRNLIGADILPPEMEDDIARDFPQINKTGFMRPEDFPMGPSFRALLEEVRGPEFARAVGAKLGVNLVDKPSWVTVRKWSALKDGRAHTDGADKLASALIYLNRDGASGGNLRFLEGPDQDGPGTAEVNPGYGHFIAFPRLDNSWHGHTPFEGERRVVQIAWLVSDEAVNRKAKRHGLTEFLKKLFSSTQQKQNEMM
ncbi:2OG-Fe(II) oxygenase [Asticcacaulis sp. EMRT-3]|uniref:2OG-Fe(II) oxygenase n=1 Tax=Asticcacaulis sp. EMRT-3 TaxID=3040349 RepID=UPI0024AFA8EF|nr:2OG-Fe(II) oxygenase [Asticcacaulis sp. EMRT-3]MDI7774792.1 2OG-Fe(II) oxygenase [Asticcacaulis sp. EMRT-3]